MAIFRSKSGRVLEGNNQPQDVKISSKDAEHYKIHTANMHDPILTAVNEAQPFEQAADRSYIRRPSYLSQESNDLKDVFGNPIKQSDMSNPTRSRNERPLDTIRAFEYSITGDPSYREQLETQRLGWGFHEDFSYYNLGAQRGQAAGGAGYDRPVISFNDAQDQPIYQAGNYSATSLKPEGKKKKKGLFGRKK